MHVPKNFFQNIYGGSLTKQKTHSRIDRALKDPNKILAGFKWQYVD